MTTIIARRSCFVELFHDLVHLGFAVGDHVVQFFGVDAVELAVLGLCTRRMSGAFAHRFRRIPLLGCVVGQVVVLQEAFSSFSTVCFVSLASLWL